MGTSRDRTIAWPTGTLSISVTKPFLPFNSIYHSKQLPSKNKEKKTGQDIKNYEFEGLMGQQKTSDNQKEETKKYMPGMCDYFSYTVLEKNENLKGAFRKLTGLRKQKIGIRMG